MLSKAKVSKLINLIVTSKSVIPICDCIKIVDGIATVTNLSNSIEIPVTVQGNCLVDAKKFLKLYTEHNDISVSVKDGKATFVCDKNKTVSMVSWDFDEFPKYYVITDDTAKITECGSLFNGDLKAVQTALQFATNDQLRPALMHVLVNEQQIASTDGNTLFYKKVNNPFTKGVLIDRVSIKAMDVIDGVFDFSEHDENLIIENKANGIKVFQRVCTEIFPDYNSVIPVFKEGFQPTCITSIDTKTFIKSIDSVKEYANKSTMQIKATFDKITTLYSEDFDLEHECSVSVNTVSHSGEFMIIGFSAKKMLKILNTIEAKNITLTLIAPNKCMLINDVYLLMPVMLTE